MALVLFLSLMIPGPMPAQEHDFCGEAALVYWLAAEEGVQMSQREIHEKVLGLTGVRRGAYSREIIGGLRRRGYTLHVTEIYDEKERRRADAGEMERLSRAFKKSLDQGHPLFIGWYPWEEGNEEKRGHFSVIVGYDEKFFYLYDPRFEERLLGLSRDNLSRHLFLPALNRGPWGLFYFHAAEQP